MLTDSEYSIRENRTLLRVRGAVVAAVDLTARVRRAADRAVAVYRRSRQRARLRRELQSMEERQFHDIGLTRAALEAEAAKPFWRR